MQEPGSPREWTFLSNHGHVMVALSRDPDARVRDLAVLVGITERAVQAILLDLEDEGYLTRERIGRRNRYQLHPERTFRHPAEADRPVRDLLQIFAPLDHDTRPAEKPPDQMVGLPDPAQGWQRSFTAGSVVPRTGRRSW